MPIMPSITAKDLTSFPKRLRYAMSRARLSAAEFARRMEVSSTAVWNWLKNGRTPRPDALARMAFVLAVSEEFLMTGRDAPAEVAMLKSAQIKSEFSKERGTELMMAVAHLKHVVAATTGMPVGTINISISLAA